MTTSDRHSRVESLVAQEAARRGERVDVVHVCAAAVAALRVDGAAVSAMSSAAASHPLCGTDEVSRELEELQLTLGEGPRVDAFAFGGAVLSPDLGAADVVRSAGVAVGQPVPTQAEHLHRHLPSAG